MKRLGYVPALDGIRGVAIALVVTGHAFGFPRTSLGVDLFFVLSGFLITTLLLEGRYPTMRSFYAARARRLLPALAVLLAGYVVVEAVAGRDGLGAAAAAGSYGANLLRITGHDAALGSLRHTWSLAMEEQFYLLWPVVLLLVLRCRRRPAIYLLVAALAWYTIWPAWLQAHGGGFNHLEYGPDTRGAGLTVGCLIAVARPWLGRAAKIALPFAVLFFVWIQVVQTDLYATGALTLFCLACGVLILHSVNGGIVGRALSIRPLVWLGGISYSLYLWHFPILIWMSAYDTGPIWRRVVAIAVSVLAAVLSGELVEKPFRFRTRPGSSLWEGGSRLLFRLSSRTAARRESPAPGYQPPETAHT